MCHVVQAVAEENMARLETLRDMYEVVQSFLKREASKETFRSLKSGCSFRAVPFKNTKNCVELLKYQQVNR